MSANPLADTRHHRNRGGGVAKPLQRHQVPLTREPTCGVAPKFTHPGYRNQNRLPWMSAQRIATPEDLVDASILLEKAGHPRLTARLHQ